MARKNTSIVEMRREVLRGIAPNNTQRAGALGVSRPNVARMRNAGLAPRGLEPYLLCYVEALEDALLRQLVGTSEMAEVVRDARLGPWRGAAIGRLARARLVTVEAAP